MINTTSNRIAYCTVDYGITSFLVSPSPYLSRNFGLSVRVILSTTNLFGDRFLQSAYVVYDLDHKEIGLAQLFSSSQVSRCESSVWSHVRAQKGQIDFGFAIMKPWQHKRIKTRPELTFPLTFPLTHTMPL